MQETKTQKYQVASAISDQLIDDAEAMTFLRKDAVDRWHHMATENGYTPVGEPTVHLDANTGYGWPLFDGDDPILGDDGEQLTDHTKAILSVRGPVVRS